MNPLFTLLARTAAIPISARRYRRFERLLRCSRDVQRENLLCKVRRCRDTRFGRDHHFGEIRSYSDFRRQVPVARYDHFAPYIDAVAGGELSALFPDSERLLRFTITTGTTGVPKLNPVTATWLMEYRQAWNLWGVKALVDHPEKVGGRILQMAGTWNMGKTPAGFSISMVSALVARYQGPLVRRFYAIPNEVTEIHDPDARYYAMLRLSVADQIGMIILMNPGTLLRLAEMGNGHCETLIRDIRDGTLSHSFEIPNAIRAQLAGRICHPDPAGARRLEGIVRRTGGLYPRDYWPEPIIGCWLGGTAGYQARYLRDYFGQAPLRDLGLVSSEGRHTIPVEDDRPYGVPAVTANFYEFVPVSEIESLSPVALEGHELEEGEDYYLLMTTSSGYYRFNIGDIVRCRGFLGQAPLLEFLQKGDRCGDLEGEKVTEHQFVEAAGEAAAELGIRLGYITAVPSRREGRVPGRGLPCYVLLVERRDVPDVAVASRFLESVDRKLTACNFLYSARRREQVLGPPQLWRIPDGAWSEYVQREIARRGTGEVQYKHPGLVQDAALLERFTPLDSIGLPRRSMACA
jgi:hypothetical protein